MKKIVAALLAVSMAISITLTSASATGLPLTADVQNNWTVQGKGGIAASTLVNSAAAFFSRMKGSEQRPDTAGHGSEDTVLPTNGKNGQEVKLLPMVMAWRAWETVTVPLELKESANIISLKNTGGTKFYIDRLTAAPVSKESSSEQSPVSNGKTADNTWQIHLIIIIAAFFIGGLFCIFLILRRSNRIKEEKN